MKRLGLLLLLLGAGLGVNLRCSSPRADGPEPITFGRDTCGHCRMILSQPGFGGEIRDGKGVLSKYDDIGCLTAELAKMGAQVPTAWVEDHDSGKFVPLASAHLVRSSKVTTPMASGVLAFADEAAAKQFAASQQGEVVALASLLGTAASTGGKATVAATDEDDLAATPGGKRPFQDSDSQAGKLLYQRECGACHGDRGDGNSNAAGFLDPKPRDFTKRVFKLRTTESGRAPATRDILRTIRQGIPGSAMPAFNFLPASERRQIAAYVLNVADLLDEKEPEPLPDPGMPPPTTEASVAHGKELYEKLQCGKCHGERGKGDGPSAGGLKDDAGNVVPVRDFTSGQFRGGSERKDLYYRFMTGMDGTPMPSFGDSIEKPADRWALVDFVMSLRETPAAKPRPADPILAGREVTAKYSCRGCHVLDDGKGGDAGPNLLVAGQKLGSDWIRTFLKAPREYGKIYPWRPSRMPHLGLGDEEIDVLVKYLLAMGKRKDGALPLPNVASFPADKLEQGKNYFVLRCTECHTLGDVIVVPLAKQQGPDLIKVANRVDFDWAKKWISDPKNIDAKTKMTLPDITPEIVESVRMFVWKTSIEAKAAGAAAPHPATGGP